MNTSCGELGIEEFLRVGVVNTELATFLSVETPTSPKETPGEASNVDKAVVGVADAVLDITMLKSDCNLGLRLLLILCVNWVVYKLSS